jgi:hypothetical protein
MPDMVPSLTVTGKPVKAHYLAVFNQHQQFIGSALKINPPATIMLQYVGDRMGFQLRMAREISIVLSKPEIVGVALLDKDKKFLVALSIPGRPEERKQNEEFVLRSRYVIMAPKKPMS